MDKLYAMLLLSIVAVSPVWADDDALRSVLDGRYAAMKSAMAAHDGKAIAALLLPDFVSVDASGQSENADQMIQEVNALPKDPNKESKTTLLSVKLSGDKAVVDQRYDMKTTKIAANGSKRNVELITVSTDTWVNSGGNWLLQRTVTNQMDYLVNGHPTVHKVRTSEP